MDIIFLSEVKIQTNLGVPAWERLLPQTIILDIEVALPNSKSCKSDDIQDTLDYAAIVAAIQQSLSQHHFQLVEALAEHVCQLIMQSFGAPWVKIKVAKPHILPGVKALGVVIERGNKA
jgi:dihydroneopterin aldolase